MSKPTDPRGFPFNLHSIPFERLGAKMQQYLVELSMLHKERAEVAKVSGTILFGEGRSKLFYEEVLSDISEEMKKLPIFSEKDDAWHQAFRRNFYKLFIDRNDSFSKGMHYYEFNRLSSSADYCYAEGFALGFLFMLQQLQENHDNPEKIREKKNFINLLRDFNLIVTAGLVIKSGVYFRFTGVEDSLAQVSIGRQIMLADKSRVFYSLRESRGVSARLCFDSDYDHEGCIKRYMDGFFKELSRLDVDKQTLFFEMSCVIGTYTHLSTDGNGRTGALVGWLFSLLNDQFFPVPVLPYSSDPIMLQNGKEWIVEFMRNPNVEAVSQADLDCVKIFFDKSKLEYPFEEFLSFLFRSFVNDEVRIELEKHGDICFFGRNREGQSAVFFNFSGLSKQDYSTGNKIDISLLNKVFEEHREEICREKSVEERHLMICRFCKSEIDELVSKGPLSQEMRYFVEVVNNLSLKIDNPHKRKSLTQKDPTPPAPWDLLPDFAPPLNSIVIFVAPDSDRSKQDPEVLLVATGGEVFPSSSLAPASSVKTKMHEKEHDDFWDIL